MDGYYWVEEVSVARYVKKKDDQTILEKKEHDADPLIWLEFMMVSFVEISEVVDEAPLLQEDSKCMWMSLYDEF